MAARGNRGIGLLGWKWLAGRPVDGVLRTNATLFRPPTKALHPLADRSWWHWRPGWHRGAIRAGTLALVVTVAYGLVTALFLTLAAMAAAAAAAVGYAGWRASLGLRSWTRACAWDRKHPWKSARAAAVLPWQHYTYYVRPLKAALTAELGVPPGRVKVPFDRSSATVHLPSHFTGSDKSMEGVTRAVSVKLALEAPDRTPKLNGHRPRVKFTLSDPPPFPVSWEDIAPAVKAAGPNELVFGIGRGGKIVKASYSDSPHLLIPGGSGGGKSNLAAVLLLQELIRGSLIFNLDPKWISHLWLQDLPNVINAHDTPDLHLALCWLGKELLRRTKAAYYSAGGTGRVRGSVGDRIIGLGEELNYGMPGLKEHWREIRAKDDPKLSPAIAGLSSVSCAGRASDIHEWLIAQLMTVAATGVSDSTIRTNAGLKAMLRWDLPGWHMAVGKHIAMPPPTTIPGRIQLVTGDSICEVQVPYLHLDDKDPAVADAAVRWARGLAVSGIVAKIPSGPEGVPPQLWPSSVLRRERLALPPGRGIETPGTVPPLRTVTYTEAIELGVFGDRKVGAVRKAIQRAALKPAVEGKAGVAHKYYLKDLHAIARKMRPE